MPVTEIIDGFIDLIEKNLIAKTNTTSNVTPGSTVVFVDDSFHFEPDQEVILIDYGYNVEGDPHFKVYEYAKVKEVNNTWAMTMHEPIVGTWLTSQNTFVQKTIGHSPLYEENVLYGDREVIPTEDMAITIEPLSMSNEWIYMMGGLSEEYRVSITIYGKDIETEQGMKILNQYTDATYKLMMSDLHIDVTSFETPLLYNTPVGATVVEIQDTEENREKFVVSERAIFEVQDNLSVDIDRQITNVSIGGGHMQITLNLPLQYAYSTSQFAVLRNHDRYFYDSRIDNIEYGTIQKGSAFIRAARLNWFGKEIEQHRFPQQSKGVDYFEEIINSSSSSSSVDSTSSSSIRNYSSSSTSSSQSSSSG